MEPKLSIELIPQPTWGINARSLLTQDEWDVLRKHTYQEAAYRCEICGGRGRYHPVECHERWEFDEDAGVQTLVGLIALCPECHQVKHFGRANIKGQGFQATTHLQRVNEWNSETTQDYITEAFQTWNRRSAQPWEVDVSSLRELLLELTGEEPELMY